MNSFSYQMPADVDAAVHAIGASNSKFIGGGTNLLDLIKQGVAQPEHLVDVNALPLNHIQDLPNGGLSIGALVRNSDAAAHPAVRMRYPLLTEALVSGASPQLRNMATMAGNLMQRTRCYYFYDPAFDRCNKRMPGSGCGALEGQNRIHAIFGASEQCIAVNPSDMSVALAALEPVIKVQGPRGKRDIAFADFHRLPGDTPQLDTTLQPDELILSIELPPSPYADRSHYLKVRDRASYAFALVSVAAALDVRDGVVQSARIALGGVAHKPWRAMEAEAALHGKPLNEANISKASDAAALGARPYEHNKFKVELARRSVRRAIQTAGGMA